MTRSCNFHQSHVFDVSIERVLIEGSQQFAVRISQHKTHCVVFYAIVNAKKRWRAEVVNDLSLVEMCVTEIEDALLTMYADGIQVH